MHLKMFYFENKCSTFSSVVFWQPKETHTRTKMPRSSAERKQCHERLRHTMAFLLNHIFANHLAGLELGVMVERFLLAQLYDLRRTVIEEIEKLQRDEEEGFVEDWFLSSSEDEDEDEDEDEQEVEP